MLIIVRSQLHDFLTKAGEDFEPVFLTTTFKKEETNSSIAISLIDDDIVENLERLFVTISTSQVGVEIISPQRATVIITNDDSKLKLF